MSLSPIKEGNQINLTVLNYKKNKLKNVMPTVIKR